MFTVYSDKNIFENIILDREQIPNWHNIFCNHADVCLDMTDQELEIELQDGTIIFEYVKLNGGKLPIAHKPFFSNVYQDYSIIVNNPRSAFFLDVTEDKAKEIQDSFGIIVQSLNSIDDNILKGTYYKNLPVNSVCKNVNKIGWHCLLNFSLPPSNSIVLTDNFLFSNEDGNRGTANFIHFIDSILPDSLTTDFHILLLAQEHKDKVQAWCERKAGEIKTAFGNLNKPYNIIFELVFAETIHKRIAISNYYTLTPDKGFAIFKTNDNKTVHEDTDIQLDRIFNRLNKNEGDSEFLNADYSLHSIKKICLTVAQYISNRPNDKNYRILGDCNKNKSLKNRLINDV